MIKVIEDLNEGRTKSIVKSISRISGRLDSLKENVQNFPDKYDLEILVDILTQIYDDIEEFNITVYEEADE